MPETFNRLCPWRAGQILDRVNTRGHLSLKWMCRTVQYMKTKIWYQSITTDLNYTVDIQKLSILVDVFLDSLGQWLRSCVSILQSWKDLGTIAVERCLGSMESLLSVRKQKSMKWHIKQQASYQISVLGTITSRLHQTKSCCNDHLLLGTL